jgi:putative ABC transport system permease protein
VASGFASSLGVVLGRLGMPSRLAVANAKRNPTRTATTANALLIGVFLVVFVTAAGGAVRDYAVAQISQFSGADLNVAATSAGISPELEQQIVATPGIKQSVPVYDSIAIAQVGEQIPVAAGDFKQLGEVLGLKVKEGDLDTLTDTQIVATEGFSGANAPKLGQSVTVDFKSGTSETFTVGAVIQISLDAPGYIVSSQAATTAIPDLLPNKIAMSVESGQLEAVQDSLEDLTLQYSSVSVQPGNAFALIIKSIFNALISSVNALLALAVAIAVFGIVNTLILSVTERTTEIGLLRSVGMSRRQLRSSIRSESVIVAADGTIIGIAFGLFVAWVVTKPLFTDGSSFSWPWREMAVIALLGVAIGVIAAIIPAWRASRLDVLEAVRSE